MELLLALLSLLTAATGAVAGARAPEAGVHHAAANVVAIAPARHTAERPSTAPEVPLQAHRAAYESAPEAAPHVDAPLETERLIE